MRMNWREFLKPNVKKIILAVIIFITAFSLGLTEPLFICSDILNIICTAQISQTIRAYIVINLVSLIIIYLLSCIIFSQKEHKVCAYRKFCRII